MELEESERRSRLTLARRILSKDADVTGEAIAGELGGLLDRARRTITHDDGGEFPRHETVADGSRGPTAGSQDRPNRGRSRLQRSNAVEAFPCKCRRFP